MSGYQFNTFSTAVPVTNHDTNANHYRALLVVITGNLVVKPWNGGALGSNITITGAPVGMIVPFEVALVLSTGSTATVAGLF